MSAPIKLSIITVNLNNANGLSKTLESVASQTFTNYEHIIIDGGSTDGSVDIIKDYERKYNGVPGHLYWVSEPDKGIYNAMNKGIKVASGEYCLFLNSGDWLVKNSGLSMVFSSHNEADILYCNIVTSNGENWEYPDNLSIFYFINHSIGHPGTLLKRNLFKQYGLYDETFKIAADYYFFLKSIIKHSCSYQHLKFTLTNFDTNGISSLSVDAKKKERLKALHSLFPAEFDYIEKIIAEKTALAYYENSRLIQAIKKMQTHTLYKQIRKC